MDAPNDPFPIYNDAYIFYSEDVLPQPDKHTLTIMKELSAACQQNPTCLKVDPIDRLACIRRYVVVHTCKGSFINHVDS